MVGVIVVMNICVGIVLEWVAGSEKNRLKNNLKKTSDVKKKAKRNCTKFTTYFLALRYIKKIERDRKRLWILVGGLCKHYSGSKEQYFH
jgi:hypothetical protein